MANLITVGRLLLLFATIGLISWRPVELALPAMLLIAVVFAGDGIDGWIARRRNSTSRFGAVFDIAGDRVVETVLWVVFANLGVIPVWVPLLVITRGAIVDALRSLSYADGMTAFGERNMMRSPLTQWLTAGRFMRALYGYAKAAAFVFLTGEVAAVRNESAGTLVGNLYDLEPFRWVGWAAVWLSVALTVVRGVPVIVDALPYLRPGEPHPATPPVGRPIRTPEPNAASGRRA